MGMSVDANVLIYERIREELRGGKGIKLAVADGYKGALSAILDSNITTLLTGCDSLYFWNRSNQRICDHSCYRYYSLHFSVQSISPRLIYEWLLKRNAKLSFSIKITANILKDTHIDFIGKRKIFYAISIAVTVIGIGSLFVRGLSPGIDFTGGRTYVVRFENRVRTADVAENLTAAIRGSSTGRNLRK